MQNDRTIVAYAVQHFNNDAGKWLVINDRILVRDFQVSGTPYEKAVARAEKEADRQVTGWSAGYPRESYRAVPIYAR